MATTDISGGKKKIHCTLKVTGDTFRDTSDPFYDFLNSPRN
jgi:hypothetical protein